MDANAVATAFGRRFGRAPQWVVRAPGRINLIGEHTDYNGFPVLPMAIAPAVWLAASARGDDEVRLANACPGDYPARAFRVGRRIEPSPPGDWANYPKAASQALARTAERLGAAGPIGGVDALVGGDLPQAAGLSSSTALVIATGLALCAAHRLEPAPEALAELMAEAEHYVGTRGGGMDQAVCLLAQQGAALKVDFFPLRAQAVPFPPGWSVVAAHSTVQAAKSGLARAAYNERVDRCREATELLARQLGVPVPCRMADLGGAAELLQALADLQCAPAARTHATALRRARHVLTEADRTERAARCLRAGQMAELGRLMDASHASCAEDYAISCPELDELVDVLRGSGAVGARLTGAGFGGFAIGLVPEASATALVGAVEEAFYAPRRLSAAGRTFVFRPAQGATVQARCGSRTAG